jgi:hypothetical protein
MRKENAVLGQGLVAEKCIALMINKVCSASFISPYKERFSRMMLPENKLKHLDLQQTLRKIPAIEALETKQAFFEGAHSAAERLILFLCWERTLVLHNVLVKYDSRTVEGTKELSNEGVLAMRDGVCWSVLVYTNEE